MKTKFMQEALRLAKQKMRAGAGGPFGAVVVKDGKIIARGWNQVTSTNDPTAHAEVVAIRAACRAQGSFKLSGCELYTSCEPCPMCLAAIYWSRLDKVFYAGTRQDAERAGFDDALIYRELPKPPSRRRLPMKQLRRAGALAVFAAWREKPDKIPY